MHQTPATTLQFSTDWFERQIKLPGRSFNRLREVSGPYDIVYMTGGIRRSEHWPTA